MDRIQKCFMSLMFHEFEVWIEFKNVPYCGMDRIQKCFMSLRYG